MEIKDSTLHKKAAQRPEKERCTVIGGAGGSRTHAPLTRPKAFRVPPLGPLEYCSLYHLQNPLRKKREFMERIANEKRKFPPNFYAETSGFEKKFQSAFTLSSAPSYDHLSNAPQHKFCTAYYNSLRGKCQFFAGGKMSGGKMSVGGICNERLRFLHDVLQGRQVVQNIAGFQGMIGVLIKTERRAVGAGCGGDGGSVAPGVGGA